MDKSQNRARKRDTADLAALVEEIIAYWKELARKRFYSQHGVDPEAFEELWPQILDNFFLAETVRVARKLRFLSQGRDN
jgi:CelD/BcsL family acetyltransferase involved in cellulose biosynthesis